MRPRSLCGKWEERNARRSALRTKCNREIQSTCRKKYPIRSFLRKCIYCKRERWMRKLASTSYIVEMCQNMFVRFNKRYSRNKYWTITGNVCARNVRYLLFKRERLLSQSDHRDLPGDLSRNLEETLCLPCLSSLHCFLRSSEKRFEKMWSFPWLSSLTHGTLFVEQSMYIVDIALIHLARFESFSNASIL